MSARDDLQVGAAALAAGMRAAVEQGKPITYEQTRLASLAHGARAALEAAALVDVDPAPIEAAIDRFYKTAFPGQDVVTLDVEHELDAAAGLVVHYRREAAIGAAVAQGYAALRGLIEGLIRDFAFSDTPTAQRTAARLHTGLEEAEQAIQAARGQEE